MTDVSPIESEMFQFDPYPILARLREEDPVHWVPGQEFWWVTRHDDVRRLLDDPENVTGDRRAWERDVVRRPLNLLVELAASAAGN